jgi:putative hydrolase of the HAD superfamily
MNHSAHPIKLITFDLDNTLWDADPVLYKAEAAMRNWMCTHHPELASSLSMSQLMALKTKVLTSHPELKGKVSALRQVVLKRFFLDAGFTEGQADRQAQAAFDVFYQTRQKVELFDDAMPMLKQLSVRFMLGSLTNGNASTELIGIDHLFAFSLNAEDVGREKPAPDMFLKALALSDCLPEQVIHVGDHLEQDIWAAQQLGIRTIWVDRKGDNMPDSIIPDERMAQLSELPDKIDQIASKI